MSFPTSPTWSSGPEILRYDGKTTKVCPFTQWYCAPTCALADVIREDKEIKHWSCGLMNFGNRVYKR